MGVSFIMTHKLMFILDSDTVCPMCMEEEEELSCNVWPLCHVIRPNLMINTNVANYSCNIKKYSTCPIIKMFA